MQNETDGPRCYLVKMPSFEGHFLLMMMMSAFTLAQRYEHEIILSEKLPKLRPDGLGFAYLKKYVERRDELIGDFSKFRVKHNLETGCKTRSGDGCVSLKGINAPVAEVAWGIFQPGDCNDIAKKPGNICSTPGCFAFEHSLMMGPVEAAARKVCQKKNNCECSQNSCILKRKFSIFFQIYNLNFSFLHSAKKKHNRPF